VLLREAYHRISNHLQLLASAIGLLARENNDPSVREALLQVQSRVFAVARLHAELQRPIGDESVDIAKFLHQVHDDLISTQLAGREHEVRLDFDIQPAAMPAETAVSLAVIVVELVTNAMKYGIPPGGGEIRVRLEQRPDREWRLSVGDDGPGMPGGQLPGDRDHGLDFVRRMAKRFHGRMEIEPSRKGATVSVCFPDMAREETPEPA
jgi:two-component sensor histidine kinase